MNHNDSNVVILPRIQEEQESLNTSNSDKDNGSNVSENDIPISMQNCVLSENVEVKFESSHDAFFFQQVTEFMSRGVLAYVVAIFSIAIKNPFNFKNDSFDSVILAGVSVASDSGELIATLVGFLVAYLENRTNFRRLYIHVFWNACFDLQVASFWNSIVTSIAIAFSSNNWSVNYSLGNIIQGFLFTDIYISPDIFSLNYSSSLACSMIQYCFLLPHFLRLFSKLSECFSWFAGFYCVISIVIRLILLFLVVAKPRLFAYIFHGNILILIDMNIGASIFLTGRSIYSRFMSRNLYHIIEISSVFFISAMLLGMGGELTEFSKNELSDQCYQWRPMLPCLASSIIIIPRGVFFAIFVCWSFCGNVFDVHDGNEFSRKVDQEINVCDASFTRILNLFSICCISFPFCITLSLLVDIMQFSKKQYLFFVWGIVSPICFVLFLRLYFQLKNNCLQHIERLLRKTFPSIAGRHFDALP